MRFILALRHYSLLAQHLVALRNFILEGIITLLLQAVRTLVLDFLLWRTLGLTYHILPAQTYSPQVFWFDTQISFGYL